MSRSRNCQNQRGKTEMLSKKPVGIKLVFDHSHDDSHGTAVVHVFSSALALAFNLLDMLPDMVCYTPVLEYPGICTDYELMDAATNINKAISANNFATAEHFIVCSGDDGGVYIFMVQGASGPTLHERETELIAPILLGRVLPIVIVYNRADFDAVYAAMAQKPRRVWPAQEDGRLQFVGPRTGRLIGATLDETLAATR